MQARQSADGTKTRLPLRWPQWETGKTIAFLMPSRPVDTRTALGLNILGLQLFQNFVWNKNARLVLRVLACGFLMIVSIREFRNSE
jgi:hypothetical protein